MRVLAVSLAMMVAGSSLGAAEATIYEFQASGVLGSFYTNNNSFQQIANPPTSLKAGDPVSVSFFFDTAKFAKSSYKPDAATTFFDGPISDLTYRVGSFTSSPVSGSPDSTSFLIWNNHLSSYAGPTDALSFSVYRYIAGSASPVQLGTGPVFLDFGFYAFDFTGKARSTGELTEQPSLSQFSQSAFVGFSNSGDTVISTNSIQNLTASISAVPEPASWLLMSGGMGMVGGMARRRRAMSSAL